MTDGRRDRIRFSYDDAGRVTRQRVLGPTPGEWRYSYRSAVAGSGSPVARGRSRLPHIDRASVTGPGVRRTVSFASSPAGRALDPGVLPRPRPVISSGPTAPGSSSMREAGSPRVGPPTARSLVWSTTTHDRPISIVDPDGTPTRFGYTRAGDLASVTDGAGTTRYGWNAAGQQTSETDPLGHRQRWGYDRAGRLVWFRDARGIRSTFEYDAAARPRRQDDDAGSVKASYDQAGRRTSLALPGGMRIDYGTTRGRRPHVDGGGRRWWRRTTRRGGWAGSICRTACAAVSTTRTGKSPGSATREVVT